MKTVEERFWPKVRITPGCWLWEAATVKFRSIAYGSFKSIAGSTAHRFSWHLHFGPIPEGKSVLHKCDFGLCVNPDHLFLGTQTENMQDALKKGRLKIPQTPILAVCKSGLHDLTVPENREGTRCRLCRLNWQRSRYERIKARQNANRNKRKWFLRLALRLRSLASSLKGEA